MNQPNEMSGKFMVHGEGLGIPDEAAAEDRAREIARAGGRTEFNEKDLDQARQELLGADEPPQAPEVPEGAENLVAWDDAADETGHRGATRQLDDEASIGITLVQDGLEEAEHDRRVTANDNLEEEIRDDEKGL
jgi:hypothetical protein